MTYLNGKTISVGYNKDETDKIINCDNKSVTCSYLSNMMFSYFYMVIPCIWIGGIYSLYCCMWNLQNAQQSQCDLK